MRIQPRHPWAISPQEAQALQRRLAAEVSPVPVSTQVPDLVAGVDISPVDAEGLVRGAVVVLRLPELEVVEVRTARQRPTMPYVPGLLAFREAPVLAAALERVEVAPGAILVDGHGLAHPRRFGIACHLGLLAEVPAIGCAKSVLVGRYEGLGEEEGSWAPLTHRGEVVGAAVRTRAGVSPIFVSVGHKIDLQTAIAWTLACCRRYRLPEPTRLAHQAAAGLLPERGPGEATPRQARLI